MNDTKIAKKPLKKLSLTKGTVVAVRVASGVKAGQSGSLARSGGLSV
jgi:predicted DNA-binding antitoxin AbrB/MazE fold protein